MCIGYIVNTKNNGTVYAIDSISISNNVRHLQTDNGTIIGGTLAPPGKYPFFVEFAGETGLCCAGSLIRHDIVLTTADCAIRCVNSTVYVGNTMVSTGTPHSIINGYIHPTYSSITFADNVAVLKLNCSSRSQRVRLNYDARQPTIGSNALVAGFGTTEYGNYSEYLREATIRVLSFTDCFDMTNSTRLNRTHMVCGRAKNGAAGPGVGDFGTPLIMMRKSGTGTRKVMVQVGLFSLGRYPFSVYPEVYARTQKYLDFISAVVILLSNKVPQYCN
jgi:secreted trypsin-like serine protease